MEEQTLLSLPVWVQVVIALFSAGVLGGAAKALWGWYTYIQTGRSKRKGDLQDYLESQVQRMEEEIDSLRLRATEAEGIAQSSMLASLQVSSVGEDSPIAMWMKDLKGRRLWHNRAYEALSGIPLAGVINKTDAEIMNDEGIAGKWKRHDDEVIRHRSAISFIEQMSHIDRPDERFLVIVFKWATVVGTVVQGTQGAAIRLDHVERLREKHRKLVGGLNELLQEEMTGET